MPAKVNRVTVGRKEECLPALCLDPEEPSLSTLAFFFLEEPESEAVGLFSTAGVDRALFLKSSLSLSNAGSILTKTHIISILADTFLKRYTGEI